MRKRRFALGLPFVVAAALILALGVSNGSARTQKKAAAFKAAWIYVGPHNDGGWSQAHDKGRLYVQSKLGSKVQTT
jgi:basic membrane lipoprotein Med (substrate-binding protein (PBP1-ABC) superfamily)